MSKPNGFSFTDKAVEKGWFGKLMRDALSRDKTASEQLPKPTRKTDRKKK